MSAVVPWSLLEALIEPHYPKVGPQGGRRPFALGVMVRIYCLQQWYNLSDPGAEEALYDIQSMRAFVGLDLGRDAIPDETTILNFRHLLERHDLTKAIFEGVAEHLAAKGELLRGGTIVDATLIAASPSTKNKAQKRDPGMSSSKKGNQWYFGMKAHIGVDAGTGYVHSVSATAANVHDLDESVNLVRDDDEVVYADAGYQGVERRRDVAENEHLSGVEWRVAARKGWLKMMPEPDRHLESRKAAVRAKVEHPFLIIKRDFGFIKTRYRGIAKNLNQLQVLFASANWLMRARAVALMG
jgi:IS5 family transposase